jgi:hypothetical protein
LFFPAVEGLLADAEPATDLGHFLAAFDLVQGVNDLFVSLRGIVCVFPAGVAGLPRKSQIARFHLSAVPILGFWVTITVKVTNSTRASSNSDRQARSSLNPRESPTLARPKMKARLCIS